MGTGVPLATAPAPRVGAFSYLFHVRSTRFPMPYTYIEDSGFTCCNNKKACVRQGRLGREKIMSSFGKFTLLTLAAFLVLALSITANAAKGEREQQLASPPLWGEYVGCNVANLTDETLQVSFRLHGGSGLVIPYNDPTPIEPKEVEGWGLLNDSYMWCEIIWDGQADDVKASICAWLDSARTLSVGCINID